MADKKISELDAITGANTAATDAFVVVDTSTGQTKKITREELNNAIEQDVLSSIDIDTINGDFSVNGNINLGDDNKAIFGAGSDLQIYHNGSNSYIDEAGSGGLYIRANSFLTLQKYTGENLAQLLSDGEVRLFYDGGQKLATKATGIDVNGTVTADNLKVEGSSSGRVTVSKFINTTNAGSTEVAISLQNSLSTDPCNVNLVAYRDGANYGSDFYIETSDNTDGTDRKRFYITEGGDISFYEDTGTTAKLFWDASAERLGLGTSSVYEKLTIGGADETSLTNQIAVRASDNDDIFRIRTNNSTEQVSIEASGDSGNGFITFGTGSGSAERLRITSAGRVGINRTSPNGLFHMQSPSGTDSALYIQTSAGTDDSVIHFGDDSASSVGSILYDHSTDSMQFETLNSERARLDSSGNLLAGRTSASGVDTDGHVLFGGGASYQSNTDNGVQFINRNGTDGKIIEFYKNGATVGSIGVAQSGDRFYISGNTYGFAMDTSDASIMPSSSAGVGYDNVASLGKNAARFKDLHLSGTAYAGILSLKDANDNGQINATNSGAKLYYNVNDAHIWQRQGSEKARLDASGNLLVKKTAIDSNAVGFQVDGGSGKIAATVSGAEAARFVRTSSDGEIVRLVKDTTTVGSIGSRGNGTSYITLKTTSGVGAGLTGSDNRILPMDESALADNNTDLGMSSYRFKDLHLGGTAYVGTSVAANTSDGSDTSRLSIGGGGDANSTGRGSLVQYYGNEHASAAGAMRHFMGNASGAYISWHLGSGTEAMRITSAGLVGIGESSPDGLLHLTGDTNSNGAELYLQVNNNNTTDNLGAIHFGNNVDSTLSMIRGSTAAANNSSYLSFYNSATGTQTERMRLETDGDLHVDGNVVAYSTTVSDIRLKKDIAPIEDAVTKVQQLNGCTFTYLKDDRKSAGLIAQDVEKVLPSAVIEDKAVFHGEEGETYKTVQYDQVIGLLVEAVKELSAKVEELENASSK